MHSLFNRKHRRHLPFNPLSGDAQRALEIWHEIQAVIRLDSPIVLLFMSDAPLNPMRSPTFSYNEFLGSFDEDEDRSLPDCLLCCPLEVHWVLFRLEIHLATLMTL